MLVVDGARILLWLCCPPGWRRFTSHKQTGWDSPQTTNQVNVLNFSKGGWGWWGKLTIGFSVLQLFSVSALWNNLKHCLLLLLVTFNWFMKIFMSSLRSEAGESINLWQEQFIVLFFSFRFDCWGWVSPSQQTKD